MIKVNKDRGPAISRKYNIDGEYVPRVLVMMPDGKIMHDIYPRTRHKFSAVNSGDEVAKLMRRAISERRR